MVGHLTVNQRSASPWWFESTPLHQPPHLNADE
jgi:hypothetical protein